MTTTTDNKILSILKQQIKEYEDSCKYWFNRSVDIRLSEEEQERANIHWDEWTIRVVTLESLLKEIERSL